MKRVQKESLDQYRSLTQSTGNKENKDQKQDVKKEVKQQAGQPMEGSKKKSSRKRGMSV